MLSGGQDSGPIAAAVRGLWISAIKLWILGTAISKVPRYLVSNGYRDRVFLVADMHHGLFSGNRAKDSARSLVLLQPVVFKSRRERWQKDR
jgi:hypothetical protein